MEKSIGSIPCNRWWWRGRWRRQAQYHHSGALLSPPNARSFRILNNNKEKPNEKWSDQTKTTSEGWNPHKNIKITQINIPLIPILIFPAKKQQKTVKKSELNQKMNQITNTKQKKARSRWKKAHPWRSESFESKIGDEKLRTMTAVEG